MQDDKKKKRKKKERGEGKGVAGKSKRKAGQNEYERQRCRNLGEVLDFLNVSTSLCTMFECAYGCVVQKLAEGRKIGDPVVCLEQILRKIENVEIWKSGKVLQKEKVDW